MSQKKLKKAPKEDIVFTLKDFNGNMTEFNLTPLKQRTASKVFHTVGQKVLKAIGGSIPDKGEKVKMGKVVEHLAEVLEFDDIWFIVKTMMADAMVNATELEGDFDDTDIFEENPQHLYMVFYHGVKGNWPGVFSKLDTKMAGFASRAKKMMMNMGQSDEEQTTD